MNGKKAMRIGTVRPSNLGIAPDLIKKRRSPLVQAFNFVVRPNCLKQKKKIKSKKNRVFLIQKLIFNLKYIGNTLETLLNQFIASKKKKK
jgi:hypothetical protein